MKNKKQKISLPILWISLCEYHLQVTKKRKEANTTDIAH